LGDKAAGRHPLDKNYVKAAIAAKEHMVARGRREC